MTQQRSDEIEPARLIANIVCGEMRCDNRCVGDQAKASACEVIAQKIIDRYPKATAKP